MSKREPHRREGMMKRIICGMLLSLAMTTPAPAFESGDWVLGRYQGGRYWYPGVVQRSSGDSVRIHYDDGGRETLPVSLVRRYDWQVGTRVQCNWQNRGSWYGGVIRSLGNNSLRIDYDDGDSERTRTGMCRSR
jgi:hypothetical protein